MAELTRIAARFQIPVAPASEICVIRPVTPADPARMLAAMKHSLPDARIEIVDYSRGPVPEGEMDFPVSGLHQTPSGGLWYGAVRYGAGRTPVWAKVKAVVSGWQVVAASDLEPLRRVDPAQLRLEPADRFPAADGPASVIAAVAGRVARRAVRAGTPVRESWFDAPREVERGDLVTVEVRSGGAVIELEGEAQAAGSAGQLISIRNAQSKKLFRARVEGKGRVSVIL
jgi:flagella basal body P-ring formation protein FlgA